MTVYEVSGSTLGQLAEAVTRVKLSRPTATITESTWMERGIFWCRVTIREWSDNA